MRSVDYSFSSGRRDSISSLTPNAFLEAAAIDSNESPRAEFVSERSSENAFRSDKQRRISLGPDDFGHGEWAFQRNYSLDQSRRLGQRAVRIVRYKRDRLAGEHDRTFSGEAGSIADPYRKI